MTQIVFDIQRSCIHDGPGIRTTVFLKGCNLRCKWCHNPESLASSPQLSFSQRCCTNCGSCAQACPNGVHVMEDGTHYVLFEHCRACGICVKACPQEALRIIGTQMETGQVLEEVLKDLPYYQASGGGITISGGEPTCQINFLADILREAKLAKLHTALETNGFWQKERLVPLLRDIDLFLLDFKHFDNQEHLFYTGVSNQKWFENMGFLEENHKAVILRCPIIPGVNDGAKHFRAIADMVSQHRNVIGFEVMPYHGIGAHKWQEIGLVGGMPEIQSVSLSQKNEWTNQIQSMARKK